MTSRDFCANGTYCLTKAVLINLSDAQTPLSGFKLYQQYLKSFVLTEPDTNLVAHQRRPALEQEAICSYYKKNHNEDPAFFHFFNFNVSYTKKYNYLKIYKLILKHLTLTLCK